MTEGEAVVLMVTLAVAPPDSVDVPVGDADTLVLTDAEIEAVELKEAVAVRVSLLVKLGMRLCETDNVCKQYKDTQQCCQITTITAIA